MPTAPRSRPRYYPIRLIERHAERGWMLGLDLASEPARAEAIRRASESGEISSSPPIQLMLPNGHLEPGIAVAAPAKVGRGEVRPGEAPDGMVLVGFQIRGFLDAALGNRGEAGIDVRVSIGSDLNEAVVVTRAADPGGGRPDSALSVVEERTLAGRTWTIECTATASYGNDDPGPRVALIVGLLAVGLLTAYLYLLTERTARTELAVRERTATLRERAMELKRANERLVRQSAVMDATPDFVGLAEPDGGVLLVNQGGRALVGLDVDADVRSMTVSDFHPEWSTRVLEETAFPIAVESGSWSGELALMHRDGEEIPVSAVILAHLDADGGIRNFSAVMRDIRDRKRLEIERSRYFSASMDLMCIATTDGYFLRVNPAWQRTLGYTEEELCSRPFVDFVHPDDRERTAEELGRLQSGADTVYFENRYRAKNGSYRWLAWNCPAPERGSKTLYATARDITVARQTQEALREAKEAAESANRAKSQFLANMSHELRTPLNAIMGYSYLLEQEALERGAETYIDDLHRIHTAGEHLLRLINDVLDLSKIEAGRMELHLERFAIAPLIAEVLTTVAPLSEKNRNTLESEVPEDIGTMHADPTRLRQILLNLLSNAAKFTQDGRITMKAERHAGANGETLRFEISDTGIGMTAEQVDRVFDEFAQADSSTTRRYGGTGLGLTITRRFCEMMGGQIDVASRTGQGSTFAVTMPADVRSERYEPPPESTLPPKSRSPVLIIDDDPRVRSRLCDELARWGYGTLEATGGEQGLLLAQSQAPCAITLDVNMPALDGWAVLESLSRLEGLATTPVFLLTLDGGGQHGCLLATAPFVPKPLDADRLASLVRRITANPAAGRALVIDDDPSTSAALVAVLGEAWTVQTLPDPHEALDRIAHDRPDLIILHMTMRDGLGIEMLDRLLYMDTAAGTPMILVTDRPLDGMERQQLDRHVARVLREAPARSDELLQRLCRRLAHASHGGAAEDDA
jgi:PAS domain S-box-containing protein